MEARLREYRAIRRRQQLISDVKEKIKESTGKFVNFITPKFLHEMGKQKEEEVLLMESEDENNSPKPLPKKAVILPIEPVLEENDLESAVEDNPETWRYFIIKWTIYGVIWLTLYGVFLKLQFGAVFFVLSLLVGICLNTRTKPKKKGEISAYSVFNKNCVSIDGTLKAEQFEREIRYGARSVR